MTLKVYEMFGSVDENRGDFCCLIVAPENSADTLRVAFYPVKCHDLFDLQSITCSLFTLKSTP